LPGDTRIPDKGKKRKGVLEEEAMKLGWERGRDREGKEESCGKRMKEWTYCIVRKILVLGPDTQNLCSQNGLIRV
jgi:hypothetical protein